MANIIVSKYFAHSPLANIFARAAPSDVSCGRADVRAASERFRCCAVYSVQARSNVCRSILCWPGMFAFFVALFIAKITTRATLKSISVMRFSAYNIVDVLLLALSMQTSPGTLEHARSYSNVTGVWHHHCCGALMIIMDTSTSAVVLPITAPISQVIR